MIFAHKMWSIIELSYLTYDSYVQAIILHMNRRTTTNGRYTTSDDTLIAPFSDIADTDASAIGKAQITASSAFDVAR